MSEDILSPELIMDGLESRIIGQKVLYYPSVTSTNVIAKREAGQGVPEGTTIIAGEQTEGRGRLKRTWLTPMGNIAISVVLYPDKSILPSLIMMASLAVIHSIESVTGLEAQIKWPNDVLIDGRKVCGILIETDIRADRVNYAVIGIGINVNIDEEAISDVYTPATSLSLETGAEVSRLAVIREILTDMDKIYDVLLTGGSVYEEWRERLVTLGKEVRVTVGDEIFHGIAESADEDGSLFVRSPDGKLNRIIAGDVTLRG